MACKRQAVTSELFDVRCDFVSHSVKHSFLCEVHYVVVAGGASANQGAMQLYWLM